MTDRELLELAAKAVGYKPHSWIDGIQRLLVEDDDGPGLPWNPLVDDGDALRLAVKLGIKAGYDSNTPPELGLPRECGIAVAPNGKWFAEAGKDKYAATRRAIVRAAAGKAIP